MKKLLITLFFLPLAAMAQDAVQEKQYLHPKHEIAAAIGVNLYPSPNFEDMHSADVNFVLGYMRNFSKFQLGVRLESGSDFFFSNYLSPVFLVNKTFNLKRSYLYAGSAVGYYHNRNYIGTNRFNRPNMPFRQNGYSFGAQGGGAFYISRHLAFTTEVAVRSVQTWDKEAYYMPPAMSTFGPVDGYYTYDIRRAFFVSFPVTIGIRYKF